jgi:AcrR family transcriptional regulator
MDQVYSDVPSKRRGGRSRLLTHDAIARAAFELADAEGPTALTIKSLAGKLGVGQMTLYGYAASKDEIVGMLPDVLLADLPPLAAAGPWKATMEDCFTAVYRRLVDHSRVTQTIASSAVFGGAQVRLFESVLEVLHEAGFEPRVALTLHRTLSTYTIGYALFEIAEAGSAPHRHRVEELSAAEFPRIAELAPLLRDVGDEDQFTDGLRRILEGFVPAATAVHNAAEVV